MMVQEAVELAHLCPRSFPDPEDDGCKACPLLHPDDGGYGDLAACDHIRAVADAIGDMDF